MLCLCSTTFKVFTILRTAYHLVQRQAAACRMVCSVSFAYRKALSFEQREAALLANYI